MKILLYSHSFWPKVGGTEDVAHSLAKGLVDEGVEMTVVTKSEAHQTQADHFPFRLLRRPKASQLLAEMKKHDLVHVNGSSMSLFPIAFLLGKPFSWSHHGYQLICIDGAGWLNKKPAPLSPFASFVHCLRNGKFEMAIVGGLKLILRRFFSSLVAANVATSRHLAKRQPLPRQVIIYNPFQVDSSVQSFESESEIASFGFVGRLVSEKGVDTLLRAFAIFLSERQDMRANGKRLRLNIVGDGPECLSLKSLAAELGIADNIFWRGTKSDGDLAKEIDSADIFVIPSAWEEPGALMVFHLLARQKPMIVSERGWLAECAGDACLTFPNQDFQALAKQMIFLYDHPDKQAYLSALCEQRLRVFEPQESIKQYKRLFQALINKSKPAQLNLGGAVNSKAQTDVAQTDKSTI